MKKRILALVLCLSLMLAGCQSSVDRAGVDGKHPFHNAQQEEMIQPSEVQISGNRESTSQLLMVYMVGSNLESEAALASVDLSEIVNSGFDEENMTILICTGGSSYWWIEEIPTDECCVFEASAEYIDQVYTMSGKNMAAPATLREFIDYGYANYDADMYSVIFWDHGGGAVLGFGLDENHGNDVLTLEEMDQALASTALIQSGERFEWVGFDACLMGMLEVADLFSDYANYLIASEELEPGDGWDYACLKEVSQSTTQSGADAAEAILEKYRDYYENSYKYPADFTLSCLDLSYTDSVISGLEGLIGMAAQELQQGGYSKIAKVRTEAKTFGKTTDTGIYDTVDLYDLAQRLIELYPNEAAVLQNALNEMVVQNVQNVYGAHGVAIYFPYENKEYADQWLEIYETTGFSQDYITFLRYFTGTLSGEQMTQWEVSQIAPEEDPQQTGNYYVQMTQEQMANFAAAKYSIWEEEEGNPGNYICWLNSRDVSVSADGRISSTFDGNIFYVGDTSGNALPCCATEIDRNEAYVKYSIPVIVWPADDADVMLRAAYIHVRVDADYSKGQIVGIYNTMDAESSLYPNRDLAEISEGDEVYPYYFARKIVTREDGTLASFDEWTVGSGTGNGFTLSGDLKITMGQQEIGAEYCCLFLIQDTQGNVYYTNSTFVEK